jgi:phosphate transport system substrate-binding protein
MRRLSSVGCGLCIAVAAARAEDARGLPQDVVAELRKLPAYVTEEPQSGTIRSVGSSTVSGILNRLEPGFQVFHPNASITIRAGGSGTAAPALTDGSADLAPMSRPMNPKERDAFVQKFGYQPTEIDIAIDAVAVYVNVSNPTERLTLRQVDAIFSSTRDRGGDQALVWSDVGVTGELQQRTVRKYGLHEINGAYGLFKDLALLGGAYRGDVSTEAGPSSVVNAVGAYPEAIGYASQCLRTRRVKYVALAADEEGQGALPTYRNCIEGTYPLARRLFLYVNRKPGEPLPPLVRELLIFVQSRPGQAIVAEGGHFPVDAATVERQAEILRER